MAERGRCVFLISMTKRRREEDWLTILSLLRTTLMIICMHLFTVYIQLDDHRDEDTSERQPAMFGNRFSFLNFYSVMSSILLSMVKKRERKEGRMEGSLFFLSLFVLSLLSSSCFFQIVVSQRGRCLFVHSVIPSWRRRDFSHFFFFLSFIQTSFSLSFLESLPERKMKNLLPSLLQRYWSFLASRSEWNRGNKKRKEEERTKVKKAFFECTYTTDERVSGSPLRIPGCSRCFSLCARYFP